MPVATVFLSTAPVYDLFEAPVERVLYGAWRRILWREVHGSEVLEIGVGTRKNIPYYPPGIHVTAVDLSSRMFSAPTEWRKSIRITGSRS